MSRTITATQRTDISGRRPQCWARLEIWDSTSTYVDYTTGLRNIDWLTSLALDDDQDANCATLAGQLLRESGTLSLAPFRSDSLINLPGGTYATMLDLWRSWKISVAVKPEGYPPTSTDWKYIGQGRVDVIDTGDEAIRIQGRTEEAVLLDKWIDTERSYGSGGGIAMETVIQSMLDDNLGTSVVTLYTPSSPGYLMNSWTQPKGSLMVAIQAVAAKAGFKVRYRYDSSDVYRFTLYKPDRTASVELWAIGPSEYTAVPLNKIDISGVRNFIKLRYAHSTLGVQTVIYPHMAGTGTLAVVAGVGTFSSSQAGIVRTDTRTNVIVAGIAYTISAFNGTTGCTVSSQLASGGVPTFAASAFTLHDTLSGGGYTTSLSRFGRRDMEIDLSYESQVNDATKAQGMADAVGPDMEFPNLEQGFEGIGWWFMQLHDYGKFLANGVHYDSAQYGGVTSIRHDISNGTIKSTVGARGKPSGAYTGWRMLAAGTDATNTAGFQPTYPLQVRARVTATAATTITVRVAVADPYPQGTNSATIAYSETGTGAATSPATGQTVTPAATIAEAASTYVDFTVTRPAFGVGAGRITFTVTAANRTTAYDAVDVPEVDRDTVELLCRGKVQSTSATQVVVRVAVADPVSGGSGNVTVTYTGVGVGTISPASPQTLTSASITSDIDTTATVDITVNRAAFGTGMGRITFTATRTGRAASTDSADVPSLDRDTQAVQLRVLRISEAADQVVVRVEAITPNAGATVTVVYDAGGLSISPSSGGTLTSTTSFGTTAHIDYTITRDTQGGSPRRVTFTASASGNVDGTDGVDVPPNSTRMRSKVVVTGSPTQTSGTTPTVFTAWTESGFWDIGGLHDDVTNPSRLTIPTGGNTGAWLFHASMSFQFNATGDRFVGIYKNGTSVALTTVRATSTSSNATVISAFYFDNAPTVGDYYEVFIWQNSGSTLNTGGGTSESFFSAIHLW